MGFHFGRAGSADEIEAVQRLRYTVYVEELGRYRDVADRTSRTFAEPEADHSWIFYARDGVDAVGPGVTRPPHGLVAAEHRLRAR